MMKKIILWILAVLITLSSAIYQRCTGPTYAVRDTVIVGGEKIPFRLERSHETGKDFRLLKGRQDSLCSSLSRNHSRWLSFPEPGSYSDQSHSRCIVCADQEPKRQVIITD